MRCRICKSRLDANKKKVTCSDICAAGLRRSEMREEVLAPERRLAQCQICLKHYSAAVSGDSQFCSIRCRDTLWDSFVA